MYHWACPSCEAAYTAETPGHVTAQARTHLIEAHRSALIERHGDHLAGDSCDGCGEFRFESPVTPGDAVCPNCSRDNLAFFAGKRVWQGLERVEK